MQSVEKYPFVNPRVKMKTSGQKSLSKIVSVYTLGFILQKNIRGIKTTRMAHTIRILFLCRSVGWKCKRKAFITTSTNSGTRNIWLSKSLQCLKFDINDARNTRFTVLIKDNHFVSKGDNYNIIQHCKESTK